MGKQAVRKAGLPSTHKMQSPTLGENRIMTKYVKDAQAIKTTAVEDDMKRRGEKPLAAREQAQPAWHQFKRTAKQRMEDDEKRRPVLRIPGGIVVTPSPRETLETAKRMISRIQQRNE